MTRITSFTQMKLFDNTDQILKDVLVKTDHKSKALSSKLSSMKTMISKADHQVLIFTSNLASSEIEEIIHGLVKEKGVRCYLLTASKTYDALKKSPFKDMIMRSKSSVGSTFVLVDPKTNAAGIWSPDPLVENEFKKTIKLDQEQITELYGYFIQHFWNSKQEMFFGRERDARNVVTSENETITSGQQSSIMQTNLSIIDEEFFGKKHLLTLPRFTHASIDETVLMDDAKVLLFEPGRLTKELVKSAPDTAEVFVGQTQEMLLVNSKTSWVFTDELGLKLNSSQMETVETWNTPLWRYYPVQKIGELETPIIPSQSSWEDLSPVSIENEIDELVEDLSYENIDDWVEEFTQHQNNKIRTNFELEEKERLTREIRAERKVVPPYLAKGATKHRIYDKWPDLLMKVTSIIDSDLQAIDEVQKYEKAFKDKISKKSIKEYLNKHSKAYDLLNSLKADINELLDQTDTMSDWDSDEILSFITQTNSISEEILTSSRNLTEVIENQKTADLDELQALDKKKVKLKGDRKNLVTYLKKFSKTNLRELQIDPTSRPPYLPPATGELWEFKNNNFIVIEEIEEIEPAKELSAAYENARIAVRR